MTEWNDQVPTASDILANSQAYKDLMNTMQNMINSFNANQGNQGTEVHPTTDELDQFHKSWFYNNWSVRFRRLMSFTPLGTRGVIAIPNTTFEEWLWWFHEWMQAFMEDYNAFKKLVLEAIQAIEKHLELIDKEIDDIEKHLQDIDKHLQDIDKHLQDIDKEINNINNEINQIKQDISNLQNQVNQNTQNIKNVENKEQTDINTIKGLLGRYGQMHYIDFSDNQDGWEQNPDSSVHGFGVMWAYLTDNDHQAGYQIWINIDRMIAKNVSVSNLKPLTIDLTQVAPDVATRPMDVTPDYNLWMYNGYIAYISGPNVGASGNIHFHMTKVDSNHAKINFMGMSGEYSNGSVTLSQIEIAKGKPNPIITYINPDPNTTSK